VKNLIGYVVASIALLVASCSSLAMSRRCPCEEITLPPAPIVESCIANNDGTMFCNGILYPAQNSVCRSALSDSEIFRWIDFAVETVGSGR
jgi:hypothetical protein